MKGFIRKSGVANSSVRRNIVTAAMVATALLGVGVGLAATAGADAGSGVIGSPFNGGDGTLDTTPAGSISNHADLASGQSDNIFGSAPAAKEQQTCPTIGNGPLDPKSDLTNFWIGEATGTIPGTPPAQNNFLYLAWKRVATTGDANIDFELNQSTQAACVGPTVNNLRTAGDLLVQYNFQSTTGAITLLVYNWVTSGTCDIGSISTFGGCWQARALNPGSEEASVSRDKSFGEAAINLQASGIFGPGQCENLASAFAKSRASQSPTADMKDYIAPAGVSVENCSSTATQTTPSETVVPAGGSLTDAVKVTGNATQGPPTGSVTFYVCPNATAGCSAAKGTKLTGTNPVTLVPATGTGADTSTATSPSYTPPAPGDYCFAGVYSPLAGNFYLGSSDTSVDECFHEVSPATISTTVVDPSGTAVTVAAPAALGTAVNDTATFSDGFRPITGKVTYAFYQNGTCTSPSSSTETVDIGANSAVPGSSPQTLGAGSYSYLATYAGDANNGPASGACEPFGVSKTTSSTATVVFDNATASPWSGTEVTGAKAFDTTKVTGISGFTPTGTVRYQFFTNAGCAGTASTAQTVTLAGGLVPNSAATSGLVTGNYGFLATYSGDSNYSGSTEACETFSVGLAPTTTHTVVDDASTGAAWSGSETVGAQALDTSSISGQQGPTPTGSVTYNFFGNGTCSGTPASTETKTLNVNGSLPDSSATGALAAGSYSYLTSYSGDSNYADSTAACEPFSVAKASSKTDTTVFDSSTGSAWSGAETVGAAAHDTSTVTGVAGFVPTGTVTYKLFGNGTCAGTSSTAQTVDLSAGQVPDSASSGPLGAGSYSYLTSYSGDSNYIGSTATCEPFTVGQASSATDTVVFDAGTHQGWTGLETVGAAANDTSTVTGVAGFVPTGTVTYKLFGNGTCAGTSSTAQTVDLSGGQVPDSASTGPLGAGSYSYLTSYSGDSNYIGSTATCEPFTVGQVTPTTSTTVFDAATNAPWAGTETTGASAYDTSGLSGLVSGFIPGGIVTYHFFDNGTCDGESPSTQTVTLSAGTVPNSDPESALAAGAYSFLATYSGDSNYSASIGSCEPFTVLTPPQVTAVKSSVPPDGSVVKPGDTIAYTITLSNAGQLDATGVAVTDQVPAGTTFISADAGGSLDKGVVTWSGLTVPISGTSAVSFTVKVDSTDVNGQVIPNVAQVTNVNTPGCDPAAATCDTNRVQQVVKFPVLSSVKSSNPVDGSVVKPGDSITYTITLSNSGLADATGVTVTDQVPAGTTFTSADTGGRQANGVVTWSGLTLPASGTSAVSFTVMVDSTDVNGQVIPNVAQVTNVNTPGCNPAAATCDTNRVQQVVKFPILSAVKSSDPADGSTVRRGDSITYTITLSNAGLADATGVAVTDAVPAGTSFVSANAGGLLSGSTVTWSGLSVPASGSTAVSFTVQVDSTDVNGQVIPNVAQFTDVGTPGCDGASTCDTNTVKVKVLVVATAPGRGTTTTTAPPKSAPLPFTGTNAIQLLDLGLVVVVTGGALLVLSRRRRGDTL